MTLQDPTGDANHPPGQRAQPPGDSPDFDTNTLDTDTLDTDTFDSHAFDGGGFEDAPVPTHWPSLPSADTATEWGELRRWVEHLQDRFGHLDHHAIPRCWWHHNDHVEALAALRDHERSSYAPNTPSTAPTDWFRALRDITALLKAWTADLGCGATHTDPPTPLRSADNGEWHRHVTADVTRRADTEINQAAR